MENNNKESKEKVDKPKIKTNRDRRPQNTRNSKNESAKKHPFYNKPLPIKKFKRSLTLPPEQENQQKITLPPIGDDDIRIIILGGVEQVGINISIVEYKNEIYIIDCGIGFGDEEMLGIDIYLPNIEYLIENKHRIKAMLITHGHLDHIGAIPFLIKDLGYPTIYTRGFTKIMIEKRQKEFPDLEPLKYNVVETNDTIKLSDNMTLRPFAVTHTIPDAMGMIFETKHGDVVYTGDLKLVHKNGVVSKFEEDTFSIFKDRKILVALTDSTNACNPGFSVSEADVIVEIGKIMVNCKARLFIGAFASQIERAIEMIKLAEKYGKKVVIEGRSIKDSVNLAIEYGLYKPTQKDLFVTAEQSNSIAPDKLVFLVTGALGQEFSVLDRLSNGAHRQLTLNKTDLIVFSSSVIPGLEIVVQRLQDKISRLGVEMITYRTSDVHSSGHANRDELEWIFRKINPKYLIPIHGFHFMLVAAGNIMKKIGVPSENIIYTDNGSVVDITDQGNKIEMRRENIKSDYSIIDGNAIGRIQPLVLRDRKILSKMGIFIVIVIIGRYTKRLKKSPDIVSRGFIYSKEERELLQRVRVATRINVEQTVKMMSQINIDTVKKNLYKKLVNMLLYETDKRPIVIPIIFVF